jgi:hypothetical protein
LRRQSVGRWRFVRLASRTIVSIDQHGCGCTATALGQELEQRKKEEEEEEEEEEENESSHPRNIRRSFVPVADAREVWVRIRDWGRGGVSPLAGESPQQDSILPQHDSILPQHDSISSTSTKIAPARLANRDSRTQIRRQSGLPKEPTMDVMVPLSSTYRTFLPP